MLKGYFDESGIHQGSAICVVAGFVLSDSMAETMSARWSTLLSRHDLAYFHAKDFAALTGPFRGWPKNRAPAFSANATELVSDILSHSDHPTMRVGAAIVSDDFLKLSLDERRWLTGGSYIEGANGVRKWKRQGAPSKPYFLAFLQAVLDATKFTTVDTGAMLMSRVDTSEKVDFIFDRQGEYESTATAVFRAMKQMPLSIKGRIGDIAFASKMKEIPLQVADFMAYEAFCYLRSRVVAAKDKLSAQASAILNGVLGFNTRYVYIDKIVLARLLSHCPMTANSFFVPPDPRYPFDSLSRKAPITSYRG